MNIITKAPKRFEDASLNRSGNTEAIREIKKFISTESIAAGNIRKCLILSGAPGTGKTFSLYALLNSCREDREVRQVALQLDGFNSSFGKVSVWQSLGETEEDRQNSIEVMGVINPDWLQAWMIADFTVKETMLQQARDVKILGIDDLGMEQNTNGIQAVIELILNHRYTEEMTTIMTTNLSMQKFRDRYSERIVDRLREWGIFYEITDRSYRGEPERLTEIEAAVK